MAMNHALSLKASKPHSRSTPPSPNQLVRLLITLFIYQLRIGCENTKCKQPLCASVRRSCKQRPARELSVVSARAIAIHLSTLPDAESRLCPDVLHRFMPEGDSRGRSIDNVVLDILASLSETVSSEQIDPKSLFQHLCTTNSLTSFLKTGTTKSNDSEVDLLVLAETKVRTAMKLRTAMQASSTKIPSQTKCNQIAASSITDAFASLRSHLEADVVDHRDIEAEGVAIALLTYLSRILHQTLQAKTAIDSELISILASPTGLSSMSEWTIRCFDMFFARVWNGDAVINRNSPAADALACVKFARQLSSHGIDRAPETPSTTRILSNRVITDPLRFVHAWMNFESEYASSDFVCVTNYPLHFIQSDQITIFRGLCFYRACEAVDAARLYRKILEKSFSPLALEGKISQDKFWPPQVAGLRNGPLQQALSQYLTIQVRRHRLLPDALDQLWRRQKRELLRPLRVKIISEAEMGLDQGGVAQEFFRLAIIEALDPAYGLFLVNDRTRMAWFDVRSVEPAFKYELIGLLVALSVHNGFTLPVTFPLILYQKLMGGKARSTDDIKDGWPELASGLKQLLEWSSDDVEDVFVRTYTFSYQALEEMVHLNMMPSEIDDHGNAANTPPSDEAPMVTNKNRDRYVSDYIDYLTNRTVSAQYSAFAKGFHTLLPPEVLCTTTPMTLQLVTEGISKDIDTEALERGTRYLNGYNQRSKYIQSFWSIVHAFSQTKKKQLLEFVTASDRIPVNGIQSIPFIIQRNGHGESEERLPTSVTCFGRLLLPEYRNAETLKRKLEIAVENARGFGLS